MSIETAYKAALVTLSLLFWTTLWLVFRLKIKPLKVERLPRKPRPDYLSKEIVDRILRLEEACEEGTSSSSTSQQQQQQESCDWLNLVTKWIYAELAPLPKFYPRLESFFEEMVLNFRRSRSLGAYITGVKLISVQLGTAPPSFKKARVITAPTEDLPLTALVMDMSYSGGILGIARLDLIGGWQVHLRCRLCELSGPLHLIIQDSFLFYGLSRITDVKIRCQLVINGVQFKWLNWVVSRLVLPEFLRRKLVFPAMKAKFLVPPEELEKIQVFYNKKG